jgi:hypothetical protein
MALWTMTDSAAGMPKNANTMLNVAGASSTLFANTTMGAFRANAEIGIFGVSETEMNTANTSSEAAAVPHAGWVLRTEGQGGRAGRVQYEVLVAGSSISGDGDDDAVLPEV